MNRTLKITAAIWVGGVLCVPSDLVEVTAYEARDLVRRGRAEYHEEAIGDAVVVTTRAADPVTHPAIAEFNADADAGATDDAGQDADNSQAAPEIQAPRRGRPPKASK